MQSKCVLNGPTIDPSNHVVSLECNVIVLYLIFMLKLITLYKTDYMSHAYKIYMVAFKICII